MNFNGSLLFNPLSSSLIGHHLPFSILLTNILLKQKPFDGSTFWQIASLFTISQLLCSSHAPKALWLWFCSQLVWVSITLPRAEFHNHLIINRKTNSKPTLCLHPTFQMTQKYSIFARRYSNFLPPQRERYFTVGNGSTQQVYSEQGNVKNWDTALEQLSHTLRQQVLLATDFASFFSFLISLSLSFSLSYMLLHIT